MFFTASKRNSLLAAAACSALAFAVAFSIPAAARRSDNQPAADAAYAHERVGPKKSVAVIDFGASGAFPAYYGDWNAGDGLAAMQEAAWLIADSLEDKSWAAHVAQVRADTLYVNAGGESGLRTGDTLRILRVVDQIVDPITGATLGMKKAEIGRAVVSSVADKYARADYSSSIAPEPGDILTFEGSQSQQPGGEPGAR